MRMPTPTAATVQAITSSTTRVVPSSPSTITAVYVPAVPTRIIEWSSRRRTRWWRVAKRAEWYTPLTVSIAVTQTP